MKLPEFSVRRKVTASMIAMILVVIGLIAFSRLGLDFFPDLEYPTVSVITTYRGASSEDIEKTITEPLEQVVSSVSGVKKVTSQSSEGVSVLMVEFEWGTNLDFAAQDIRDQIGLYRNFLPTNASNPLVVKFNLSQFPVVFYGITANSGYTTYDLKKMIEDEVKPRLERLDGVASAAVFSTDEREIRVEVDKNALISYNLSLDRVLMALAAENVNAPAGDVVERHEDLIVRTLGEFRSVEDVRNVVVGLSQRGEPIYVRDIAEVKDTFKETRNVARVQEQKGVYLVVNKRSGANTALVGNAVKKEISKIQASLPGNVAFHMAMDQAEMINMVASRTSNNAVVGAFLAIALIFLFLRNWRPTMIIAIAIPLSVITTFVALYAAGYTLNLMTLGGLALGVGMLVDNAIVVIENTFRHIEEGKHVEEAAVIGASEVGMAITASTLTTIIVFLPVVFAGGITGKLTQPLALTIVFSLVSSLFVALTLVPLFSSLLFKSRKKKKSDEEECVVKEPHFAAARAFYRRLLTGALRKRKTVLTATAALFVVSLVAAVFLGTEFMPQSDRNFLMVRVKLPVGTSLEETNRVVSQIERLFSQQPEVTLVSAQAGSRAEEDPSDMASGMGITGTHEGLLMIRLVDRSERKYTDMEILERVRKMLPRLENFKFEQINMEAAMMGGAAAPVEIKLFGKDLETLREIGDTIVKRISDVEGLRDLTHSLAQGKPEYQFSLDRERAARLGLAVAQVSSTIQTATQGTVVSRYRDGSDEVNIRVILAKQYRDTLEEIRKTPLMSAAGKMIFLEQIADWKRGEGPIQITRENQMRKISITANIAGRDLGTIMRDIRGRLGDFEKQLPPGYFLEYGGAYEQMIDAFKVLAAALALAVLLVYMVMASQFENFLHPFVIMFTIPLAIIGVIFGLFVSGKPVSLPALIGVIILAGIAVNNGIVMIDYINQLIRRGLDKREAIIRGAVTRLRPVLLTALTTILGMLPMAVAGGSGAEFRSPMAVAVVGGLTATTLLTLFIIPIVYSIFNRISFKDYVPQAEELPCK
ncbi:MAG: efflux RND transporter permease subunit [Candidatus Saccharicenans sp.]|jgi:HAE1 family hydrophobic/amphiphilic exporter-1|nr:efflux RND transporter permease subunit [Candidatus Saccharicenans sp.]MDH7574783.1 efflux RND transporter permease subunit [Candidatus Saccharicenans sp.]